MRRIHSFLLLFIVLLSFCDFFWFFYFFRFQTAAKCKRKYNETFDQNHQQQHEKGETRKRDENA